MASYLQKRFRFRRPGVASGGYLQTRGDFRLDLNPGGGDQSYLDGDFRADNAALSPLPPANTVLPVVSPAIGIVVGAVLSVSTGTWSGVPTGYAYQWRRGSSDILGATTNTYTLVTADQQAVISCRVTATNSQGSTAVISSGTDAVIGFSPPQLAGLLVWWDLNDPGVTLSAGQVAALPDKSGNGISLSQATPSLQPTFNSASIAALPSGHGYMRHSSGRYLGNESVNIPATDITSFALLLQTTGLSSSARAVSMARTGAQDAAAGGTIMHYRSSTGQQASVFGGTSASQAIPAFDAWYIHASVRLATAEARSAVNGAAETTVTSGMAAEVGPFTRVSIGAGYTATAGTVQTSWTGGFGKCFKYARHLSALEKDACVGYLAWLAGLQSLLPGGHAWKTLPPPAAPQNSIAPAVTPTTGLTLGSVLTTTNGTWSGSPSFTYQWTRDGVNIGSATASTYTLATADNGAVIRCVVTGTNGAAAVAATSNAVGPAITAVPSNSVVPVIAPTSSIVIGTVLSVTSTGTWSNSPSSFRYQWRRGSSDIAGATNASYTVVVADHGVALTCRVWASNSIGESATFATSNATGTLDLKPVNTASPSVSPTSPVSIGTLLTAATGTWTNSPASFAYQWKADNVDIGSATSSTYTVQAGDNGKMISVGVVATNAAGSSTQAVSAQVGPVGALVPVNTVAPAVTPTTGVILGTVLSTTNGTWTNSPTSYSYQWLRDGGTISGATSSSYTAAAADNGAQLKCRVTATNASGSASADSNSTAAALTVEPTNSGGANLPVLSPTSGIVLGTSLSVTTGTWANTPILSYRYQWRRGGSNISGATSSSYSVVAADHGSALNCRVWATNAVGESVTFAASNSTPTLDLTPANTAAPVVSPTSNVILGTSLSTTNGTWTNSPSFTYQWLRDGANISGATSSGYTVVAADNGAVISCRVTGTNSSGANSAVSNATGTVIAVIPSNTVAPTISPTSGIGLSTVLSVTNTGTWTNSPTSFQYQWRRGSSDIAGATSSSYTVVLADDSTVITCRVWATNVIGQSASGTLSNATSTISFLPANSVAPTVTGTAKVNQTLTVSNTGTWSNSPSSFAYQWLRDGVTIGGATASTYLTVQADLATTITCQVTASNASGAGVPAVSNGIGPLAAAVLGTPAVAGTRIGISSTTLNAAAFTPPANGMLFVHHSGRANATLAAFTVSNDKGLTMNLIQDRSYDIGSGIRLRQKLYAVPIGASPPANVVFSSSNGASARQNLQFVFQPWCSDVPAATEVAGGQGATNPNAVLGHTPASTSKLLSFFAGAATTDTPVSPPTGFTAELEDLNDAAGQVQMETAYDDASPAASSTITTTIVSHLTVVEILQA